MSEGIGVCCLWWTSEKNDGRFPSWAPVANSLAEVKMTPLTPPKQLNATKTGIKHANGPKILSPNVWNGESEFDSWQQAKPPEITYDRDRDRRKHFRSRDDREVGQIDEDVDAGHQRHRDPNGPRKVPIRVDQFAGHEVQIVPAAEGEQPRVESEPQAGRVVVPRPHIVEVLRVAHAHVDAAGENDWYQCGQFSRREYILDLHWQLRRQAINYRENNWNENEIDNLFVR